ncbi:hypothetical protein C0J52_24754 [Blattella germanica]|nr:hypothetical protein C0J52_24754 [Blattella germanica]
MNCCWNSTFLLILWTIIIHITESCSSTLFLVLWCVDYSHHVEPINTQLLST